MRIKKIAIRELKPHPKNPRVHPETAIDRLAKSIQEFGWTNPVLVSKDGFVLAGHARIKAAEKAGLKEVPVLQLDLCGAKADAYLVADNRLNELTDWDRERLAVLLDELREQLPDVETTGFDSVEVEKIVRSIEGPDAPVEFPEVDENVATEHRCPKCGYEWSGKAN